MSSKPKYKYNKDVANRIEKAVRGGVTIKSMLAGIQHLQQAPRNYATLYKVYGDLIEKIRMEIAGDIGGLVVKQAMEGDFKSQEFYLRSKGGWSPNHTVNEVEQEGDPDEDEGAIDLLMAKLGKSRVSKEE